jgi:hypothetical protein
VKKDCHRRRYLCLPLSTRNKIDKHVKEASIMSCCKEMQDAAIGRKVDADKLWIFSRTYS